jgi:DNA primase small subunit
MDSRTREYLRGRFGDHYRRTEMPLPPTPESREWGHIPFTEGPGTTMVRHRSLSQVGDLGTFLASERPRHVYYSAGRYDDPGERTMDEKGWQGSDLIFDLDADHLPGVDPETTSYAEMLAACKDALLRLVDFLERDFGFEEPLIAFSGARGYHVHVRQAGVRDLDREDRREIVDYVLGADLELEDLTDVETVAGSAGRTSPAERHTLRTGGGWGRRLHDRLLALAEEVRELGPEAGRRRLREFEGIGRKGADRLYDAMTDGYDQLAAGNIERGGRYTRTLSELLLAEVRERQRAPIDEPVTTDLNRLIRLPDSLHGGSGLVVTPIDREELESFDPLVDAVPETFRGNEIRVDCPEPRTVELGGETHNLPEGVSTVSEPVGVFLMARGRALKAAEPA